MFPETISPYGLIIMVGLLFLVFKYLRKKETTPISVSIKKQHKDSHIKDIEELDEYARSFSLEQVAEDSMFAADLCQNLARKYYYDKRDLESSIYYYKKTLTIHQCYLAPYNLINYPTIYYGLGKVLAEQEDFKPFLVYFKNKLHIKREKLPANHPDLMETYQNLGWLCFRENRINEGLFYYHKLLESQLHHFGLSHISTAQTCHELGYGYARKLYTQKSIAYYEEALKILSSHSVHYGRVARLYLLLLSTYYQQRHYSKAIMYMEGYLTVATKDLPQHHDNITCMYNFLSDMYWSQEDYEKAIPCLEAIKENYKNTLGSNHPDLISIYEKLGNAYNRLGDYSQAIYYYKQGYPIAKKNLGENHLATQSLMASLELTANKVTI